MKIDTMTVQDIFKTLINYPSCTIQKINTRYYTLANGDKQALHEIYINNNQGLPKECFTLDGWHLAENWNELKGYKDNEVCLYRRGDEAVEILWGTKTVIFTVSPSQHSYRTTEDIAIQWYLGFSSANLWAEMFEEYMKLIREDEDRED